MAETTAATTSMAWPSALRAPFLIFPSPWLVPLRRVVFLFLAIISVPPAPQRDLSAQNRAARVVP
jgi:hypothetical protein